MPKHQLKPFTIYCGDNLKMLNEIPDESVDLIYIDPPFNSNRNYEVFWGDVAEKRAFNDRFGDARAYIDYMKPRVEQLYRVLKKTGSFYYHCDWHASHYVKIMLDEIFGFNFFQNEIIWQRTTNTGSSKSIAKKFSSDTDSIFYYVKSNDFVFNKMYKEYGEDYLSRFKYSDDDGKYRWQAFKTYSQEKLKEYEEKNMVRKTGSGNYEYKQYLSSLKGVPMNNLWTDIFHINPMAKENLGYPTQKPIPLLERIINASSNEGDLVLDAFCGCGTTLVAAQKLRRKWIGIDISPTACRVMAQRLWDIFKLDEGKDFQLSDLPHTEEELRRIPPFEFQNWAVIALGGIPNRTKVNDFGIDGKLYPVEFEKKKKQGTDLFGETDIYYPIQVKQRDKAGRPDIDSFETAIRRDGRRKGYFISFDFSADAIKEIKRLDKEGEIEIVPITVKDLLRRERVMEFLIDEKFKHGKFHIKRS